MYDGKFKLGDKVRISNAILENIITEDVHRPDVIRHNNEVHQMVGLTGVVVDIPPTEGWRHEWYEVRMDYNNETELYTSRELEGDDD